MRLITPEENAPAETMLDWLELRVILNAGNAVSFNDLVDARNEEDGHASSEAEDRLRDDIHSLLGQEIFFRMQALQESYPFKSDGISLYLSPKITPGGWSYFLCLRLSLADTGLAISGTVPEITKQERELFQVCSTYAAAGYVCGESISFGWPRANNTKFLPALSTAYHTKIKEGVVRKEFLSGQNSYVKDDEVDIIAFKPSNDGRPNQFALFGQVASGNDWRNKPLSVGTINGFHKKWFEESPQLIFNFAIFIPFCPFSDLHRRNGEQAFRRCYMEQGDKYGLLFTRYRIPYFVDQAIPQDESTVKKMIKADEVERLVELEEWGREFIEQREGWKKTEVHNKVE